MHNGRLARLITRRIFKLTSRNFISRRARGFELYGLSDIFMDPPTTYFTRLRDAYISYD